MLYYKLAKLSAKETLSTLLKLDTNFPTPESPQDISVSEILKFHEQYKDKRQRFRQAIESITTAGSGITEPNALADFFNQQGKEIRSAVEDRRKTLGELKVKSVDSLLDVSAPTAVAVAAAAGLAIPPVAAVLTGVGVAGSLVQQWAEVRGNQREKIKGSPWRYLLSVKQFS